MIVGGSNIAAAMYACHIEGVRVVLLPPDDVPMDILWPCYIQTSILLITDDKLLETDIQTRVGMSALHTIFYASMAFRSEFGSKYH